MSDQDELPQSIEALLAEMERGRSELYRSITRLSDAEQAAPLTERDWSVADHLVHIAVWMDGIGSALEGKNRWLAMGADGPPGPDDFDAINERLRAPYQGLAPAEARAMLDGAHERMVARLRGLSLDDLMRPYGHYQPGEERDDNDRPFIHWVIGDTYSHYDEHKGWIEEALRDQAA